MVFKYVALDIETGGLESRRDLSVPVWCGALCHLGGQGVLYEDVDSLYTEILNLLKDDSVLFLIHNAAFDVATLRLRGVDIPSGRYIDTMLMSHCYDSNGAISLADWAKQGLGSKVGIDNDDWRRGYTPEMGRRCVLDTELTTAVFSRLRELVTGSQKEHYLYTALPLVECIMEMESTGLFVDLEGTSALYRQLTEESATLKREMAARWGLLPGVTKTYSRGVHRKVGSHCTLTEFEPKPRDVAHLLVRDATENLVYGEGSTTSSGERHAALGLDQPYLIPSLKSEHMETYNHPVIDDYRRYQKNVKVCSTFLSVWSIKGSKTGGWVRGGFNQCGTRTGRLSSSEPNLQNIPARGELGQRLRKLVVAPDGFSLIGGDLSNIEGRVLAYLLSTEVGSNRLLDVFVGGTDFHAFNAKAFGLVDFVRDLRTEWSEERVLKVARDIAKTALYAVLYGAGAATVAAGASRGTGLFLQHSDGVRIMSLMVDNFPEIDALKTKVVADTKKNGGVLTTVMGRCLRYPEINYRSRDAVARASRQVFNAKLQASAGDILSHILVHSYGPIKSAFPSIKLACQVHDELLWYIPTEDASGAAAMLTQLSREQRPLGVIDTGMDYGVGSCWYDLK